jgi:poly(A) polymerase Pap1
VEKAVVKMAAPTEADRDPRLGITHTMSFEQPTQQDLELADSLMAELKAQKNFESEEETKNR